MVRALLSLIVVTLCSRAEPSSRSCATCHAGIVAAYQQTGMARSSGMVDANVSEGAFADASSGVRYTIHRDGEATFFEFDFANVHGRRPLEFRVGSGKIGSSYLFLAGGFLYQAPVSWYTARGKWDLSPGFQEFGKLHLTRAVAPDCLQCHASALRPKAGTVNGYQGQPFAEPGITCERCHGPGENHARNVSPILNPAKLPADRRDSICEQCHLTGEAQVTRSAATKPFQPGDRLQDHTVTFVRATASDLKVASHVRKFAESACKKASGDRMWCGSCHDPHRSPRPEEKVAYFRGRCLQCHQSATCSRGPDCASCHMPKSPVADVAHTAYTDHSIATPGRKKTPSKSAGKLVPFGGVTADDRELGLALVQIPGQEKLALKHLEASQSASVDVLLQLALLYDAGNREGRAEPLYERVLAADGSQVAAAVNLARIRWKQGRAGDAARLWKQALSADPGLEEPRLSLALATWKAGDPAAAETELRRLLVLHPESPAARTMLKEIVAKR